MIQGVTGLPVGRPENAGLKLNQSINNSRLYALFAGSQDEGTSRSDTHPYGVSVAGNQINYKLWAPRAKSVELVLINPRQNLKSQKIENRVNQRITMTPDSSEKTFTAKTYLKNASLSKPYLYMFQLTYDDGTKSPLLPDPMSRYQPEDVHGPSQVIDAKKRFNWAPFSLIEDRRRLNIYELHIGTLTKKGTFQSAIKKLDAIKNAGFNSVEVMPVKEFSGKRNWGYDMVGFFATENAYGKTEDFKQFVNECHKRGLSVILDVVYNHIGPEGNYFKAFDAGFLDMQGGAWGDQFNWQNPRVREFVKENLSMWLKEYKVDGFRFDATWAIPDDMLTGMTAHVASVKPNAVTIAEDGRETNFLTLPRPNGGAGFWSKWNFNYHHFTKSMALGSPHHHEMGTPDTLTSLIEHGFKPEHTQMNDLFDGVNFFESHDEIGNYDGQRTNLKTTPDKFRLFSALKFLLPGIPMTFMGEEYAEENPFYFFTDHSDSQLNEAVRKGRASSAQPDCTKVNNFMDSKLSWQKDNQVLAMNQRLNTLRKIVPALWQGGRSEMKIRREYLQSGVLFIERWGKENPENKTVIVANLSAENYPENYQFLFPHGEWKEVFSTAEKAYGGSRLLSSGLKHGNANITVSPWAVSVYQLTKSNNVSDQ